MNHPALASHRLVRYRRRGYGANSKPAGRVTIAEQAADLADLLRYLGIQRAHVAGHSWGGLVALQLAADHPDLVGSLVLMEAALPEVVEAVAGKLEVYVDGGIRRGMVVLKALALGARAVLLGRPILWGLAVNGKAVCITSYSCCVPNSSWLWPWLAARLF